MRKIVTFVWGVPAILGLAAAVAPWVMAWSSLPSSTGLWVPVSATVIRLGGAGYVDYSYEFLEKTYTRTDSYRGVAAGDKLTVWVTAQDPLHPQLAEPVAARKQLLGYLAFASIVLGSFVTLLTALFRWLPRWSSSKIGGAKTQAHGRSAKAAPTTR